MASWRKFLKESAPRESFWKENNGSLRRHPFAEAASCRLRGRRRSTSGSKEARAAASARYYAAIHSRRRTRTSSAQYRQ